MQNKCSILPVLFLYIVIYYDSREIRGNFIAPLLKLLGYGKNTVNNGLIEKSLKLKEPFRRIGRKNIRIDYLPTVRLKSFWIIEAKPGYVDLEVGDFLQAYFYTIHPEVQVQILFFVMENVLIFMH